MKKLLITLLAVLLLAGILSGCGSADNKEHTGGRKIRIITTIFPQYDWVRNILGDNEGEIELTMLMNSGADLHSFQPTAEDILKIASCDMFIYTGGESDKWVTNALAEAVNKDMIVINLMEALGDAVKEEEIIEGMQEEEHDHDHEEETEYDEHIWLSLRNARTAVKLISDALVKLDPDHSEAYLANTAAYTEKLISLDQEYKKAVSEAAYDTVLFGDRFPFRYLTDDYGLDYYAAFVGCSAETEASFQTIIFLSRKVDELALPAVMTIENSDGRIAQTIIENTRTKDQKILSLNSMQSITAPDTQKGISYLSIMEENLAVLKEALQ